MIPDGKSPVGFKPSASVNAKFPRLRGFNWKERKLRRMDIGSGSGSDVHSDDKSGGSKMG